MMSTCRRIGLNLASGSRQVTNCRKTDFVRISIALQMLLTKIQARFSWKKKLSLSFRRTHFPSLRLLTSKKRECEYPELLAHMRKMGLKSCQTTSFILKTGRSMAGSTNLAKYKGTLGYNGNATMLFAQTSEWTTTLTLKNVSRRGS